MRRETRQLGRLADRKPRSVSGSVVGHPKTGYRPLCRPAQSVVMGVVPFTGVIQKTSRRPPAALAERPQQTPWFRRCACAACA
jgi:hypothetical protein